MGKDEEGPLWNSAECAFQHHRPRLLKLDEWLCKRAKGIFLKYGRTHTYTHLHTQFCHSQPLPYK